MVRSSQHKTLRLCEREVQPRPRWDFRLQGMFRLHSVGVLGVQILRLCDREVRPRPRWVSPLVEFSMGVLSWTLYFPVCRKAKHKKMRRLHERELQSRPRRSSHVAESFEPHPTMGSKISLDFGMRGIENLVLVRPRHAVTPVMEFFESYFFVYQNAQN